MRINNQTVAHVLPAATRARDDLASGGIVRGGALMGREGCELVVPLPLSLREVLDRESDWRRCIAAELVACTLGQRRRPELLRSWFHPGGYVTRREPLPVR